ncbi:MAG: hypothetical protein A3G33_07235 [Omnitrophica bacterium RIFCSPLOWO2_12_FULL_44_17]|uniref:Glycosyltransferase RgtA/B/C/D-like domain-containing protein n=1 Tax=Candidatus Danuiimicrobium aquiferis TaxID=1801832 RepID=A0A1G1KZE3_9BACT|nr:MAG: hypothetical protein A3B72_07535 [Omnitrophica bacterium RIFCSPHIGHO2_02_FULL_45_28]OGW90397.1 MAG: hypothetical protein A3E74_07270 [Omnitrophica bacterium RIFCSPHIGHO2_12_FULL_44_12]OGW98019.1 MAG: hypothetical protein A3G33_07235 [Omnitrophica bacterium RIFCSPLOWO2_12_FULL_44_17]OGX03536.1 MAG: hypothetical protein A3J12_02995 [Omnitrophica bacterium RIFCSPLOWO2_02_FULL_44_11]
METKDAMNRWLVGIVVFLSIVLAVSVFKNIAYPLLWNDESETAMYAKRILQYGYPKVHDGKNVVYLLGLRDEIGIDKKTDAYLGSLWGQYYFAALGEMMARTTRDIYLKTALLRIPFALIGLLGIAILVLSVAPFFKIRKNDFLQFLALFILLEILSVPIALHLREVRYYSLAIFLVGCVLYLYHRRVYFEIPKTVMYVFAMLAALFALFFTFPPVYFSIIFTIGLYEVFRLFSKGAFKKAVWVCLPVFISALIVIPLLSFFHTLMISREFSKSLILTVSQRMDMAEKIIYFLMTKEFLSIVLIVKVVAIFLWLHQKNMKNGVLTGGDNTAQIESNDDCAVSKMNEWQEIIQRFHVSNFLSLFCVIHLTLLLRMPMLIIYERYYIILQPMMMMILLLDVFNIRALTNAIPVLASRRKLKVVFLSSLMLLLIFNGHGKMSLVKKHVFEIFHQYKGPLDYAIPFIQTKYKNPEKLIIATNYEETSYMYYLDSKVIVGFVGNNLQEDMASDPDIIIPRTMWNPEATRSILGHFFQKGKYNQSILPIANSLVNNIPQVSGPIQHAFKTILPEDERQSLVIYYR